MLAGSRAVMLFADNCAELPAGGLAAYPSLSRVARGGVTGWLAVRRPERGGRRPGVALAEVLGVMPDRIAEAGGELRALSGFEGGAAGRVPIGTRYGGLGVRVLSNQAAVGGLEESLQVPCRLVGCEAAAVLAELQGEFGGAADLVFVHLDAAQGEAGGEDHLASTRRCLGALDEVLEKHCGDGMGDVLQGVFLGTLRPAHTHPPPDDGAPAWERALRPLQSSCVHNGEVLGAEAGEEDALSYAMFHSQGTRCDDVTSLAADEIRQKGANGGTLAQHLMMEIAFNMGHMPKYGA